MFLKWLLAGTRKLNETTNEQVDCLGKSLAQTIFYNVKSEEQTRYVPKEDTYVPRKRHQTRQQIGLALALRNYDRNNQVLDLLSAPGYGITISSTQALLWETRIANAVIDRMTQNEGMQ